MIRFMAPVNSYWAFLVQAQFFRKETPIIWMVPGTQDKFVV